VTGVEVVPFPTANTIEVPAAAGRCRAPSTKPPVEVVGVVFDERMTMLLAPVMRWFAPSASVAPTVALTPFSETPAASLIDRLLKVVEVPPMTDAAVPLKLTVLVPAVNVPPFVKSPAKAWVYVPAANVTPEPMVKSPPTVSPAAGVFVPLPLRIRLP
jgi:hypothetical protein